MAQITMQDVTFYYDGSYDNVFEHMSVQIDTTWRLGLTGRNGRGKTTLLKLLMGVYEYEGTIKSPAAFEYFPYKVSKKEENTIDVIEAADPQYEFWKICRELNLLSVDPEVLYRPFFTLSNGEQTKVLLSVLFAKENRFLLIDEPTNHLDVEARQSVAAYLKKKSGFILVSHDRMFLDECVDHVMAINKNTIEIVQGTFSSWWENKQRQDHFELEENEKLKKEIGRLTVASRQSGQWADQVEATKIGKKSTEQERSYIGEKSRRMQMRKKNLEQRQERAIEGKKTLLKNVETEEALKIFPLKHHKRCLVEAKQMEIEYGGKSIFEPLDFQIEQGERIFLCGGNGSGKTSIIKAILGECPGVRGELLIAGGLKVSYVSQETSFLNGTITDFAREKQLEERLFLTLLRKLDFSRVQFEKPMESYSEGQKKKVLIAKSLCERAHLYIWDEPLNFIDVFSRMQIEALILKYQPTMLLVEHDQSFSKKIATKVLTLTPRKGVR